MLLLYYSNYHSIVFKNQQKLLGMEKRITLDEYTQESNKSILQGDGIGSSSLIPSLTITYTKRNYFFLKYILHKSSLQIGLQASLDDGKEG